MNEDALRALVRDTLARMNARDTPQEPNPGALRQLAPHPSQYQYQLTPSEGPCLIEPGVPCNHCGYCQSHGH
jgi:hypothetical protein